jgi:excinuclease UvrABC nuclease subunit
MNWFISEFGPPNLAGVYAVYSMNVITGYKQILYIGSSKNIHKRIMNPNHVYRKLINESEYPVIIYTKHRITDDYNRLEIKMINKLKPVFNLMHSGREYRSYQIKL